MAIVKKNTYVAGSNNDLTNAVLNIDYNRLGTDLTHVEYSTPNFVIKVGSLVECNGSLYAVEGSDISITAIDGALFFDSSTLAFSIGSGSAPYDASKAGCYATSTKRLLKWSFLSDGTILKIGQKYTHIAPKSFTLVLNSSVKNVFLSGVGAGGNGGNGGAGSSGGGGGGGGSGAYFNDYLNSTTPILGTSISINVTNSGATTFGAVSLGKGANGANASGTSGGAGGSGGTGSGGATNGASGGGGGSSGGNGSNGSSSVAFYPNSILYSESQKKGANGETEAGSYDSGEGNYAVGGTGGIGVGVSGSGGGGGASSGGGGGSGGIGGAGNYGSGGGGGGGLAAFTGGAGGSSFIEFILL